MSEPGKWLVTMQPNGSGRAMPINAKGNRVGEPRQAARFATEAEAEAFAVARKARFPEGIYKAELDGPHIERSLPRRRDR